MPLDGVQAAERDVDPEGKHQVAEDALVARLGKAAGHPPAVGPEVDEGALGLDLIAEGAFDESRHLALERVLETGAVHVGGLSDVADELPRRVQRIGVAVNDDRQVGPADAKGVDVTVQFLKEPGGLLHVPVGADALDPDPFPEQVDLDGLVPL